MKIKHNWSQFNSILITYNMEIDPRIFENFNSGVYVLVEQVQDVAMLGDSHPNINVIGVYDSKDIGMLQMNPKRRLLGPVPFHSNMFTEPVPHKHITPNPLKPIQPVNPLLPPQPFNKTFHPTLAGVSKTSGPKLNPMIPTDPGDKTGSDDPDLI